MTVTWTALTPWAVGQKIKAVTLNLRDASIVEVQTAMDAWVPGVDIARPQLRVYAPTAVTNGSKIPYATVRKDTHSGWNTTNKDYTVAVAGLYQVDVAWRVTGATATCPVLDIGGTTQFSGANNNATASFGGSFGGVMDLTVGLVVSVKESVASYTPLNSTAGSYGLGSNYLSLTYLGPTS